MTEDDILLDLGVVNGKVRLLEHDPRWKEEAERMIRELRTYLNGDDIFGFQHVGSTSIPGIPAKPIIDIAVAVKGEETVEKYRPVMEARGFTLLGKVNTDNWMYYIGHPGQNDRTHHIHFVTAGSKAWDNYINFRDYLTANEGPRKEYEELKRKLSEIKANERKAYHDLKEPLIKRLIAEAREWKMTGERQIQG